MFLGERQASRSRFLRTKLLFALVPLLAGCNLKANPPQAIDQPNIKPSHSFSFVLQGETNESKMSYLAEQMFAVAKGGCTIKQIFPKDIPGVTTDIQNAFGLVTKEKDCKPIDPKTIKPEDIIRKKIGEARVEQVSEAIFVSTDVGGDSIKAMQKICGPFDQLQSVSISEVPSKKYNAEHAGWVIFYQKPCTQFADTVVTG